MQKLMKVGFKLNKKKYKLFNMKVFFFWGMPISAERLVLILKRQNPLVTARNLKQLSLLLGIGSYYCKFIRGYATIDRPLIDLSISDNSAVVIIERRSTLLPIKWTPECDVALRNLRKSITEAPVLALRRRGVLVRVGCIR